MRVFVGKGVNMRINSLNGQTFKAQGDLNNISREDVRERLKELNSDAPIFFLLQVL